MADIVSDLDYSRDTGSDSLDLEDFTIQGRFSDTCGWLAVVGLMVVCTFSATRLLTPPMTRPSLVVVATLALADFTNFYGSFLGGAPGWQMVVAVVFLFHDTVLVYSTRNSTVPLAEASAPELRKALAASVGLFCVTALQAGLTSASSRSLTIELGIISATCNISARMWRVPLKEQATMHMTLYMTMASQLLYSVAIVSHPDNGKGRPYAEEAAPWVAGSIIPALLEFSTSTERTHRYRKQRESFV